MSSLKYRIPELIIVSPSDLNVTTLHPETHGLKIQVTCFHILTHTSQKYVQPWSPEATTAKCLLEKIEGWKTRNSHQSAAVWKSWLVNPETVCPGSGELSWQPLSSLGCDALCTWLCLLPVPVAQRPSGHSQGEPGPSWSKGFFRSQWVKSFILRNTFPSVT